MDLYPADAATTQGGDGLLDIRDLILELFRVNNLDPARHEIYARAMERQKKLYNAVVEGSMNAH